MADTDNFLTPTYGQKPFTVPIPANKIPENSMSPRAAHRLISDELDLDARDSSDLGSYITDYMDPEIDEIIHKTLGKVFIDRSEYPKTAEMGDRVARMIQSWYHGTESNDGGFVGTPTIGSSEAVMLGLIAHRYNWDTLWKKRKKLVVDGIIDYYKKDRPFMLYARDVHTCWNKYSLYYNSPALIMNISDGQWTVDPAYVKTLLGSSIAALLSSGDAQLQAFGRQIVEECGFDTSADKPLLAKKLVRELTSVVGCVVGTTFTGETDPVEEVDTVLSAIAGSVYPGTSDKIDIPIHVDAASGGFILPFSTPKMKWDFSLPQVRSINVSNHKFGLCYPGIGTAVFKNDKVVSPDLIYKITYLGAAFTDYTVNFSRGSAMVIASYYNLVRLGLQGYKAVIDNCMTNAKYFRGLLEGTKTSKYFRLISDNAKFPMVVWLDKRGDKGSWNLNDLSSELEKKGWKLPAYPLPYTASHSPTDPLAMRVVIRQDLSCDKCQILYDDIVEAIGFLDKRKPASTEFYAEDQARSTFYGVRGC